MPLVPSFLEKELAAALGRPGGFLSTEAAFTRLAQAAVRRLVVMTPFMDAGGFRWLRRVFETAPPECRKILILRDTDRYAVDLGVEQADWLRGLQVSVHDYYLSHDVASGRQLPDRDLPRQARRRGRSACLRRFSQSFELKRRALSGGRISCRRCSGI
jgi:hypothetical protein